MAERGKSFKKKNEARLPVMSEGCAVIGRPFVAQRYGQQVGIRHEQREDNPGRFDYPGLNGFGHGLPAYRKWVSHAIGATRTSQKGAPDGTRRDPEEMVNRLSAGKTARSFRCSEAVSALLVATVSPRWRLRRRARLAAMQLVDERVGCVQHGIEVVGHELRLSLKRHDQGRRIIAHGPRQTLGQHEVPETCSHVIREPHEELTQVHAVDSVTRFPNRLNAHRGRVTDPKRFAIPAVAKVSAVATR
jgi:hypothetical protein